MSVSPTLIWPAIAAAVTLVAGVLVALIQYAGSRSTAVLAQGSVLLAEYAKRNELLERRVDKFQEEIDRLRDDNRQLRDENREQRARLERLERLDNDAAALRTKLGEVREALAAERALREALEVEVESLRAALDSYADGGREEVT